MHQLKEMGADLDEVRHGKTFACPGGAGGGYSDLVPGAQVVVADGHGSILATSHLTGGTLGVHGCTFSFTAQVPGTDFYQVTVTHRGVVTYSLADMRAQDWQVRTQV